MTVGGRLVRTGVLRKKSWGYALEEPNGSVWRLDIVPPPDRMIGRPVMIDGIRADFDMIDVIRVREGPKGRFLQWVMALTICRFGACPATEEGEPERK